MENELLLEDLIEVADVNEEILVSGRDLHKYLEIGTRYSIWINRMIDYGFDKEIDYIAIVQKRTTAQGNETKQTDHHLKLDMAKEVAMVQRTKKGKTARQHFIQTEKDLVIQREENLRLALANEELHQVAISEDKQKVRQYNADKVKYGWQNIRTVLENCDYKTIESEVDKVIKFHSEVLNKKDRANYDSHKEANKTEYKQMVRDRVFGILDDITNTTLDGVLRAVASELRVNVIKDKLQTTNRSSSRKQGILERKYEAVKPAEMSEYHMLNTHPFSLNSQYTSAINSYGQIYTKTSNSFDKWRRNFPWYEMPTALGLGVDFSKPLKLNLAFSYKEGMDIDNFMKSTIDILFSHYGIDDSLVAEIPSVKRVDYVNEFSEGKTFFLLENVN